MRKPKSKAKRIADNKRGYKRTLRMKASRKTVESRRMEAIEIRRAKKREFEAFMKKLMEARANGEF